MLIIMVICLWPKKLVTTYLILLDNYIVIYCSMGDGMIEDVI